MGSPIAGIVAEWKLRLLEKTIFEKFNKEIQYWYRNVDDIFAILENKTDETELLRNLHAIDPDIKFTMETEKEQKLNYLDVTITKNENNELNTTVYRKPNASTKIIKARCKPPLTHKLSSLRAQINRAIVICSSDKLLKEELKKIEEVALENGFRISTVRKLYNKRRKTIETTKSGQTPRRKFTTPVPDLGKQTNLMKTEAAKLNIYIPIKTNLINCQQIQSDRDKINAHETAGIHQINYKTAEN